MRKVKLRNVVIAYVLLSVFPGCLFVHIGRMAAISNKISILIVGSLLMVTPFILLALLLMRVTKPLNSSIDETGLRSFINQIRWMIALVSAFAFVYFVTSSVEIYAIFSTDQTGNGWDSPFGTNLIFGWLLAFSIGLSVLIMRIKRHMQSRKDTENV